MSEEIIDSGQFVFKPRARLIKTIGEELISNDNVAITELVKNSYDAGSPIVDITFYGEVVEKESARGKGRKETTEKIKYIKKEGASITIYDQGSGMDFDTILHAWMEPATNYKKKKDNQNPSRKFSGEKGIGRFASAKISKKLELVSKQIGKEEIVVSFDWEAFSEEENYLEDVKINWFTRPAKEIRECGTILKLNELNADWTEDDIRSLRVALSRLMNPIVPAEDFLISINLPKNFSNILSGVIERPETLNKPNYYIKGDVSKNGEPCNVIFYSKLTGKEEELSLSKSVFPKDYTAGPFSFEFKIWDRDSENLNNLAQETNALVNDIKKDLDELCGISIYRDNIRVLPYGNANNDWVRLDIRRVNNPTLRLSNNQIVGYVSIGLETNPHLQDQSNREGLVESQAFEDLKEYIKCLLNEVEQRRYGERPRENEKSQVALSLFEQLSLSSITFKIKEEKPSAEEILNLIHQKDIALKETANKLQEIISRYRRLSALGQLIDPIIHDGGQYLHKIDLKSRFIFDESQKTSVDIQKISNKASEIQAIKKDFSLLFKRLEPFGGRRRGRPKTIVIEDVIKNQYVLCEEEFSKYNIEHIVSHTQHKVTIDESELSVILMNLIQNAIYWLSTTDNKRKLEIAVGDETDGLYIIVSDNGPGVKEGTEDEIFNPYFSTKPDGIGLGLAIVGEIMAEYNGELSLIKEGLLGGASFKLLFKKRI